jgi:hypothetical protein
MKLKQLARPFDIKSIDDSGTFTGYGSTFGDMDYGRDVVVAGAFSKSLESYAQKGRKIPMLWQHNMQQPIGVYSEIREDEKGLFLVGEINMGVTQGRECHALMKQGALTGLSIGYSTVRDEWDDRAMVRKLLQVDLYEVSPVTFPMNDNGRIETVKSLADLSTLSECEEYLRDAGGFSRKEATAFISRLKSVATQRDAGSIDNAKLQSALDTLRSIKL